jgi:hypothetical protein
MIILDQENEHCLESVKFGLDRTATWRDKTDERYPGDPRNARAAKRLRELAADAAELGEKEWQDLQPYFSKLTLPKWREAIAQTARQIGFYRDAKTFSAFVKLLLATLSQNGLAA